MMATIKTLRRLFVVTILIASAIVIASSLTGAAEAATYTRGDSGGNWSTSDQDGPSVSGATIFWGENPTEFDFTAQRDVADHLSELSGTDR